MKRRASPRWKVVCLRHAWGCEELFHCFSDPKKPIPGWRALEQFRISPSAILRYNASLIDDWLVLFLFRRVLRPREDKHNFVSISSALIWSTRFAVTFLSARKIR